MFNRYNALVILGLTVLMSALPIQAGRESTRDTGSDDLTDMKITGTIKGYDGEFVKKATILIPELGKVAESDENGSFEIPGIPAGKYHIEVIAEGYMEFRSEIFELKEKTRVFNITLLKKLSEEVVVTATLTPKIYSEVPVKTQVISARQIEEKQATQLAEAIALTTGVRVENNCQNCNFTQVRINGMEGKYSQILIDSSPVFSSMIGVYGLEQIPAEMLHRIEVVKGGGSALYGGNAVAGVINVLTKEPMDNNLVFNLHQETISGRPFTSTGFRTGFVANDGRTKGFLFANYKLRQAVDLNGDSFSEIGKINSTNFGANVYQYFPETNGKLKMSFYRISENRRGGNKFDLPPHQADITEAAETDLKGLATEWNHYLSSRFYYTVGISYVDARRNTYYGSEQDLNAYGSSRNPVLFLNAQANMQAGTHLLSGGIQFKREAIEDKAVAYDRTIDDLYDEIGFFAQDDFKINSAASLLAGIRLSRHSLVPDLILTPRLSFLLNLGKEWAWRTTLSTGFRAPQVFDEDLHITQVGGEGMIIENGADLEPESSFSLSSGLDFGHGFGNSTIQMSLEFFFTRLLDTFILTEKEFDPRENALVFERINGSTARVYGLSAELGYRMNQAFSIFSGWTIQRSHLDEPEPDFGSFEMFRTPNLYGYATLNYSNENFFGVDLSVEYTGPMKVPHYAGYISDSRLETSASFLVVNAKISKPIAPAGKNSLVLSAGIFNLFNSYQKDLDMGVYRDAGFVYGPSKPRSFYAGIEFGF